MGFKEFLIDRMNIFDFVISMLSFGELIFLDGGGSALSAFRSIRMLRVTRLIRSLQYMRIIMVVMVSSIKYFIYIFLLLLLFMYIYTLLVIFFIIIKQGKELYATSLVFSDSRFNFSNFYLSLMSTFQILTLENWNDLLTLALRSDVNKIITLIYLISWIFIGNYVLLNLFLAILLERFE